MNNSDGPPDESVEQPIESQAHTNLVTCRHCGRRGLPERIASHACQPKNPQVNTAVDSPDDHTPHSSSDSPKLEALTIEWTPIEGRPREVTLEALHREAENGWQQIESIKTDAVWQTVEQRSTSPPTLSVCLADTDEQSVASSESESTAASASEAVTVSLPLSSLAAEIPHPTGRPHNE